MPSTASTRLLVLLGLVLPATLAEASLLAPMTTRQLVERAERILVGVVEEQSARWTGEGQSSIVTDVRIRVTRAMRGVREGEVITVRRLGGVVGEIGMRVFGEPTYTVGEEVVLFAERRGDAYYSVGMALGKLHVYSEGGRKLVQTDLQGAELLGPDGRVQRLVPQRRTLDDLLQEVGALMQQVGPPAQAPIKKAAPAGVRP
jgi:hypothetical protein